jgi:hypothetical protein
MPFRPIEIIELLSRKLSRSGVSRNFSITDVFGGLIALYAALKRRAYAVLASRTEKAPPRGTETGQGLGHCDD